MMRFGLVVAVVAAVGGARTSAAEESFTTGSADPLIRYIDEQIRVGYQENEIQPSEVADDGEWLRRVYLDLVGHIPPAETVDAFLQDKDKAKRSKVIEGLLNDPAYVRNFTTIWTNLSLGRVTPDQTSRRGMEKFLRESFARNRPWNDIVFDLLSAEGHFEENGAVNFLLGQLMGENANREDYTVEATARATRLLLAMQVQCTQCHNHPFNEWKQDQFWQFDSFFKQMARNDVRKYNPQTGRMDDDYSELVSRDFSGPVFYETRAAEMKVAYPQYFGNEVNFEGGTNRRLEFAKLVAQQDPNHQLARAAVNRMWGHFFGYAFTRPVDDMGPHNAPSHPDLLERLTEEFVKSGYDLKQLARWICNTEAYNLTSRFNGKNTIDDPAAGEVPLFSHMYVKTMTAEQLYDSLIVATNAHKVGQAGYEQAQEQRDRWLRDFLVTFGGADDSEPTLFSGTIPQALMMMNGELVQKAISADKGSYLNSVLADSRMRNENARIQHLFVASLGRLPNKKEIGAFAGWVKATPNKLAAYQDLYWALLNSNEFIVNH
jgi:hypothetical protein